MSEITKVIRGRGLMLRWFAHRIGIHPTSLTQVLTGVINLTELNKKRILKGLVELLGMTQEEAEALVLTIRKDEKRGNNKSHAARCDRAKARRTSEKILEEW